MSRAVQVRGRGRVMPEKEVDHLRIYGSTTGGRIVEHHFVGPHGRGLSGPEPKQEHFGPDEGNALIDHIKTHVGIDENGRMSDGMQEMNEQEN